MTVPVLRAETFYLPPPSLPADAWDQVPAAERVMRWAEQRAQRRIPVPAQVLGEPRVTARINHNRWVADCPCGSAQVVTPADPRMACTECGAGWFALDFPDDPAAIEEELRELLPHERNWQPAEAAAGAVVPQAAEPVKPRPEPDRSGAGQ